MLNTSSMMFMFLTTLTLLYAYHEPLMGFLNPSIFWLLPSIVIFSKMFLHLLIKKKNGSTKLISNIAIALAMNSAVGFD